MLCKKYETKLYILLVTLEVKTSFIRSGSSNLYCNLFSVLNITNNFACHCISSGCDFQSLCCVYVCMSVLLLITSSHIERYVFLNEYLWNVDLVAIKIRLTTYTIWYFAQTHPLLGIYHSLMASYLTYGLIAWGQVCGLYIHKLLNLQYPALHFIYFPDCNHSAIPLFTHAGVFMLHGCNPPTMNLQLLRQRNAPRCILELCRDISKIQSYNTQSSTSNNFYKQSSRLSIQLHSFSRIRKKVWKGH